MVAACVPTVTNFDIHCSSDEFPLSRVPWWLALLPHDKKELGSNPGLGPFRVEFCMVCVGFLQFMHVRLIGDLKLPVIDVCVL